MITHDGQTIPKDPNPWDPDAIEWLSMAWDDVVSCNGSMLSSTWIIPTGWMSLDERENVPVIDCDGTQYDHANQVNMSTTETEGSFTFTNRATFGGNPTLSLDRSVTVKIKTL